MSTTTNSFRMRTLAAIGGLLLVVAGCSSAGASSAPSTAASTAPTTAASAASGSTTVAAASGTVGAYLTGANGMTLYTFKPDSANTSTCTDACAQTWPPFTVSGAAPAAGAGVTGTLTTFARPDGTMQVALNGMPLYYYSGDTKAGDTTGNGKGSKWYVASPTGAAPAGGSAAPSSSASGRYGGGAY